ncbi:hypothetical protein [Dictyobacter arantiisoli]|uniref:Uncharacterized protein n=1 Tax=Dictyobacter arantiisoli TaxID=2014874 RepID=A0A5A5TI86_9CHLR|nr:hypothetical protein [Dictyobacter arantiisoli]GCF11032.1 hypothetical protein KDI_45960 [Dictyobacter arantiisoli]
MKNCSCGQCEECRVRVALLEFARHRNYAAFEWMPSSTILGTAQGWQTFSRTHTVREMFWVLHMAHVKEGYTSGLEPVAS